MDITAITEGKSVHNFSTWEAEAKALREQNTELALQVLAAEGQAEEAYKAQQQAESVASWADIRANQAINEAKALRARVAELEAVALDYRDVLHSAKAGRDLYCGMYVAKEYRFTRDQIDAALAKISTALQKQEGGE